MHVIYALIFLNSQNFEEKKKGQIKFRLLGLISFDQLLTKV
jgi:hypothetical protein